jgi:hypothetical protein
MANDKRAWFRSVCVACVLAIGSLTVPAGADEVWVAPTYQQDLGGLGVASNVVWPVTAIGAVRLAWAVPNNLLTFQSAKVALIPHAGGAANLNIFVCPAQNADPVLGGCAGPFALAFTGVPNQLVEVEVGGILAPRIGTPGANYLAVVAFTTPTTTTDHIVGLRFTYAPKVPAGAAVLGGANTFTGTQTAPSFAGSGTALTGVAKLTANTFSGTQTIDNGNLDLDVSTAATGNLMKNGVRFLHNFGPFNSFLGEQAGNFALTGQFNVGVGYQALTTNTTGSHNTGMGASALARNTTGSSNAAVGDNALGVNTTGAENIAIGFGALANNDVGNFNTAIGALVLIDPTSATGNTSMGFSSLNHLTAGDNNLALGINAGLNSTTGSNNIYLGANVQGLPGESNTMYLGKLGTQTKTFLAGVRGTITVVPNAIPVLIDSAGQLGTTSSSIRFKEDVHDMADASRRLLNLRPVTFRYTQASADGAKPIQYGLIAEEVAEVFPELAVRDADGRVETVHYETLNVLLVNEMQKQQQRIEALEQKVNDLLGRLAR